MIDFSSVYSCQPRETEWTNLKKTCSISDTCRTLLSFRNILDDLKLKLSEFQNHVTFLHVQSDTVLISRIMYPLFFVTIPSS